MPRGSGRRRMLSLGSSQPWQDVLQVMTGERRMTARALLDYFHPLKEWLEEDNARDGDGVGWGASWSQTPGGRAEGEGGPRGGHPTRSRKATVAFCVDLLGSRRDGSQTDLTGLITGRVMTMKIVKRIIVAN